MEQKLGIEAPPNPLFFPMRDGNCSLPISQDQLCGGRRSGVRPCPVATRLQNKLCARSCAVAHRAVKDMCPCRFAYRGSDSGGYGVRVAIDINPSMVNESYGLSTCNSVRWGPKVFLSVL